MTGGMWSVEPQTAAAAPPSRRSASSSTRAAAGAVARRAAARGGAPLGAAGGAAAGAARAVGARARGGESVCDLRRGGPHRADPQPGRCLPPALAPPPRPGGARRVRCILPDIGRHWLSAGQPDLPPGAVVHPQPAQVGRRSERNPGQHPELAEPARHPRQIQKAGQNGAADDPGRNSPRAPARSPPLAAG